MQYPVDTQCPVCLTIFQQKRRKQGGGKRAIYCSPKCRSLDWTRGNGSSRKASILKYDSKPESKERKSARQRKYTLAKYGITELEFLQMLTRQYNRCGGCNSELTVETARIDHDHDTNKVRGLLCNQCNWALGLARDNRARLYQLAAYLELDKSKPVIYLIGSLRNPNVIEVGNAIRSLGMECIDNWFAAGKIADDSWQEYSLARGQGYKEALSSREANHVYYFDRAYLNLSDAVVLLYPAGKSAHIEFGYATGNGKPGYILMDAQPDRYDVMTQFATDIYFSKEELLENLSNWSLSEDLSSC